MLKIHADVEALKAMVREREPRTTSPRSWGVASRPREWSVTDETTVILARVSAILRPFLRPGERVEDKLRDVQGKPVETIARAVAHVQLSEARGRKIENKAAIFWWAVGALPGQLEEGALPSLDKVDELCARVRAEARDKLYQHTGPDPGVVAAMRSQREAHEAELLARARAEMLPAKVSGG